MRLVGYALLGLVTLSLARVPEAAPTDGVVTGTVRFLRGGKETTITDGFIYLMAVRNGHQIDPKPATATIAQKHRRFTPNRIVIPVGSTVAFPNNEVRAPENDHNVFSPTNPSFDLQRYGGGKVKRRTFEHKGEYDIYCDLHVEMNAKVKVVESDYIVPVINGGFELKAVPAGKYKVVAWAPDSAESKETIVVIAGETTQVPQLNVQLGRAKPTHTRVNNTPYPSPIEPGRYGER